MNDKICLYAQPFKSTKTFYDIINNAVDFNLSAIEGFNQFELEKTDKNIAQKIYRYADEKNIIFPCFSVYADFSGDNFKDELKRVKTYADIAKLFGSPYFHHTIIPICQSTDEVLAKKKEYYDRGIKVVREIYDYAESLGIKAIYEDQGYIFNGVEGFGNFLADVNRDVGVIADFGNIYQSTNTITEFIEAFSDRICHVHFKDVLIKDDNNGEGLQTLTGKYMYMADFGKGCSDFIGGMELLKKANYNGYYAIEHTIYDDSTIQLQKDIDFIKGLI